MALTSAYKYQYDSTGKEASNLINGEVKEHTLSDPTIFILNEGLYFETGLVILKSGTPLEKGTDYEPIALDEYMTAMTGQPVYAGIKRLSTNLAGTLAITYHVLGGAEGTAAGIVRDLRLSIEQAIANPAISYADLTNVPVTFVPSLHTHKPSDLKDLDLLSQKLDDATKAMTSSRVYQDSSLSMRNDIAGLTRLMGFLRNSINDLAAVNGSATSINSLSDKIDTIHTLPSGTTITANGVTKDIFTLAKNSFVTLKTVISVSATSDGSASHTVEIMMTSDGTNIAIGQIDEQFIGRKLFVDISKSELSGDVTISLVTSSDTMVKYKHIYQL